MPMVVGVVAGAAVLAVLVLIGLFKMMWRVAEPNEALIISGSKHRTEGLEEGMGFRIVTGRGTLVMPGVQAVRKLSLDLNETELSVDCVTQQGIPLKVRGVVIFKVGDDFVSIANAGRRFLDQQKMMSERVHNVFAGHLRSIVGGLTVEDMIRDRDKLTGQTRAACGTEMEKLGLIVDSLQIHEIEDPTGYIKNLAMPHAAAVQRDARIAQAEANRLATEAEQQSFARMAEATRDSEILQAGYQAERDKAAAQARGLADAEAVRAKGLAEAETIKARAAALAENQEAVVAQQLAENWPEIVKAGASAFGNVDNMVLLNGADGMAELFAKALTMGGTGLGLARQLLASMNQNGQAPGGTSPALGGVTAPKSQKVPVEQDD
ncbi:SPFH domain-containing protein [Streptomyces sp. NPDC059627]